jgi:hypothetical protein
VTECLCCKLKTLFWECVRLLNGKNQNRCV